jgi:outer membrane protein OmpA-like peptidoglycan-associated protein
VTRRAAWVTALAVLGAVACQTGYNNAYDAEYKRLEQQQQAQQQQEIAEHAQAARFVAVIYFQTGSAALDESATRQLDWFVEKMAPYPQSTFDVQGFADATGSEATNQMLSQQRAQAVSSYLQSQRIQVSRIYAAAFSTSSPAATNETAKGRRDNRRVEITVR